MADVGDIPLCQVGEDEELDSFLYLLFITLVLGGFLVSMLLHQLRISFIHESSCFIIIGGITGCIAFFLESERLENAVTFNSEYFFLFLLPPIIFESGFNMNKRIFFGNFITILSFAIGGTIISTLVVGLGLYTISFFIPHLFNSQLYFIECISFGALISATDPVTVLAIFKVLKVDPHLYSLVFGESVLNDAISLVLYSTTVKFLNHPFSYASVALGVLDFFVISIGSVIVGIITGLLLSVLFVYAQLYKEPVLEFIILLLYAYSSYLFAEGMKLSGIVSVLFCGITIAHYAKKSLSKKSKHFSVQFFSIFATLSETIVFLYFGLSIFYAWGEYDVWLIICSIILCLFGRAMNIFPISFILNTIRNTKIEGTHQLMMWFSGLRGAMAFAMAMDLRKKSDNGPLFLTTTLVIILVTVLLQGNITAPVLKLLGIQMNQEIEEAKTPYKKSWWQKIDKHYLKPIFINRPPAEIISDETEIIDEEQ